MPTLKENISSAFENKVFFSDARNMKELPKESVHLIITSPPYYNVKNYALDGYQQTQSNTKSKAQIGDIKKYDEYIKEMLRVWRECSRVLKANGKLIINTPLMPIPKAAYNKHHTRHIFNIASDIENSILKKIKSIYLYDVYVWNRTNPRKALMFGSYPYPRNFYAQNTIEFVSVFVKDGKPENKLTQKIKKQSKLTQKEWSRKYVGYEAVKSYSKIINAKLKQARDHDKFK